MTRRSTLSALLTAGTAAVLLTGCANVTAPDSKESAQPTKSPTGLAIPAYENKCDGSQAVLSGDGVEHTLKKGCEAVSIASSGSAIVLGPTKSIVVEGNNNDVTAASSDQVTLFGSNNKLHVEGGEPEVDDQGTGNTVD